MENTWGDKKRLSSIKKRLSGGAAQDSPKNVGSNTVVMTKDEGVDMNSARKESTASGKKFRRKDLSLFCEQQIQIPPALPGILKAFTKAAIRTQPPNLLQWSVAYFQCMAKGEVPPVKDRLEFVTDTTLDGLSVGLLQVLHKQLGHKENVTVEEVKEKWRGICMKEKYINKLWKKAGFDKVAAVEYKRVMNLLCTLIGRDLMDTMSAVCQVFTPYPVGGEPYLNWDEFWDMYIYLARHDGTVSTQTIEEVRDYLRPIALANHGLIGPKDFTNQNCPTLF